MGTALRGIRGVSQATIPYPTKMNKKQETALKHQHPLRNTPTFYCRENLPKTKASAKSIHADIM